MQGCGTLGGGFFGMECGVSGSACCGLGFRVAH